MSLSCWKSLNSPTLVSSQTMLKKFDGHVFKLHGILIGLPVEIGGKTISIYTKMIDVSLDYNLLLGNTWFYAIKVVSSTVFRLLGFPHEGKIVTINQLDYCMPNLCPNANTTFPLISESASTAQSIGEGMFKDPCLMGVFPLSTPNISKASPINMIYSLGSYDPRIVSSPIASSLLVSQDPIPLPSSSLGECLTTSNHKIRRTKRKGGNPRKLKPNKIGLASRNHPSSTSSNHVGGKIPTSSHHDGKKLDNGYHAEI